MAGNSDDDLRIHRIGSVDPMEELSELGDDEPMDDDLDDDDGGGRSSRGRLLPVATAVLALLGFAGIVWYAYQWSAGSVAPEELPVIKAETEPSKIRPENPGGLEVPYQETLALNELQPDPEKPQVERLLPPPETPLPATVEASTEVTPEAPPVPAEAAPEPTAEAAPEPVPTAPKSPPAPEREAAKSPEPPAPEPKAAAPKAPAQAAAVSGGGFVLQLASLKAKERVPLEWTRLRKSFPGLLGGRELVVLPVDLGARGTFYRVQAGFFPDRASATAVCRQLKAKSQDCLVTKR